MYPQTKGDLKMAITLKTLGKLAMLAISMLSATLLAADAAAQTSKPIEARNVVLVHGAWADGSSWTEVIARLQAAGLHVTAVQNPLTSTRRFCCRHSPRIGAPGWTDRAGRPFLGRHCH